MDGPAPGTTPPTIHMKTGDRPANRPSKKCKAAVKKNITTMYWKHASRNAGTIRSKQVQKRQYCSIN